MKCIEDQKQVRRREGISNPLESPVTYTESRNVIVVIIQWMVVDR